MAKQIGTNALIDTWASSGAIIEPDLSKKNQGWTLSEKPLHEYMNFLQNEAGQKINYLLRSGTPGWSSATSYLIGDTASHAGQLWLSLGANLNSEPSVANVNWRGLGLAATTTNIGLVELATSTETQTGTDVDRAVTPAGLASLTSTATRRGLVELATNAEAQAGTDTTRAVTPAGAKAAYGLTTLTTSSVLSNNSVQTLGHGLGRVPNHFTFCLVVASPVAGWSVDDEIYRWIDGYTGVADSAVQIGVDTASIIVGCGATNIVILDKTTAAISAAAVSNFRVRVRIN